MGSLEETDRAAAEVQKTPRRVTLESIKDAIVHVEYYRPTSAPHFTIAVVCLQNGFVVVGSSAPADPANYDKALGERFAYEDAVRKIWPLMGYALRDKLYSETDPNSVG